MRIGADRLDIAAHRDQAVRGAAELRPQPLDHRLHRPVLPQEGMPPPRAEIGDAQPVEPAQAGDLFPKLGHRPGIEHLQLEPAELLQRRAAAQLHQHGERRDLPQHHLGPGALEGQLVLAVALFQDVGRQAQALEPFHELGAEHLPLAIEGVAAQPGAFATAERQRADMVELLAQFAFVDQLGQADPGRAVDQAEGHLRVGAVPQHRLGHQELVEIGVDQRPDDRVDLPAVIPDPCSDVGHAASLFRALIMRLRGLGQSPIGPADPAKGGMA